ncbi:alpha/beta fold hydrolase [Streptomyces sp. NPDC058045]|uniref:alpha/beta fold hydrolase n=1 Tax=Streptomyces sp. NPDC058045 TaxID=3346311 RepID=UPI0036E830FB
MSRFTRAAAGPHAPLPPARELTVRSADGAPIHVELHGRTGDPGAPAVVLSHGWTCSTAFWAAQLRDLSRDHLVIAYDQRGHGRSPAPAGQARYSTGALADDLVAVLEATLGPGRRAVVAGHSMGAMTIIAAARREEFRARAAAALLCSTGDVDLVPEATVLPLRAGRLRTRLTRAVLGSRLPLGPVTPVSRRILRYATMGPGSAPAKVDACARIVHACPTGPRRAWSQVLDGLDLSAEVPQLTVPTAVLTGTADRLTPLVHARRIAAALPRPLGLTELTGLGHMTPVEAPEAVNARIRELVTDHLAVTSCTETDRAETEEAPQP